MKAHLSINVESDDLGQLLNDLEYLFREAKREIVYQCDDCGNTVLDTQLRDDDNGTVNIFIK